METERSRVLLAEGHEATRRFLAENLAADGYEPLAADRYEQAVRILEGAGADIAIVDPGLPGRDGLELLGLVRGADGSASRIDPGLPVILLSARTTELDRVRGFERGCDDYVTRPFSYIELRARVRALLARTGRRPRGGLLRIGPLELDPLTRQVTLRGQPVPLSKKEYAFLRALAGDPTRVYTREELLRDVWGYRTMGQTRTLDSHACRLRKKLNAAGDGFIVNVWGVGYRLVDGPARA